MRQQGAAMAKQQVFFGETTLITRRDEHDGVFRQVDRASCDTHADIDHNVDLRHKPIDALFDLNRYTRRGRRVR